MNISDIHYASAGCTIGFSFLSIFGSFIIFWTYWLVPSVRNFTRKLLIWLTLADVLNASGTLFGTINFLANNGMNNDAVCHVQGYITTFAAMASFFWTLVITAHMMVAIQFQSHITSSLILQVLYHAVCWGIPGIITFVAGFENVIGPSSVTGTWCFITDNLTYAEQAKWILISGKSWEIMCYILSLSILVLLKLKLHFSRRRLRELNTDLRDEDTHYLYLWLLLWLLRVWGTIRFLLVWIDVRDPDFLLILQSIGDNAQAFGNCILFCVLDKEVMEHIKRKCISSTLKEDEHEPLIPTSEGSANNEKLISYSTE